MPNIDARNMICQKTSALVKLKKLDNKKYYSMQSQMICPENVLSAQKLIVGPVCRCLLPESWLGLLLRNSYVLKNGDC